MLIVFHAFKAIDRNSIISFSNKLSKNSIKGFIRILLVAINAFEKNRMKTHPICIFFLEYTGVIMKFSNSIGKMSQMPKGHVLIRLVHSLDTAS